jgi:MFS transporter, SP family, sugar:H+ symporter
MTQKNNIGFILLITLVATIGGFLFGFDSGVINGTVDGLRVAFHSDKVGTGFNVASILLGCAAGAFASGRLADRYGRRNVLLIAAVCFTVSAWGSGYARGSMEFVLYRLLGGLGIGAASVLAPAYISEVAPAKYRGMLSSIQQIAALTGLVGSFLSNYLIAGRAGSAMNEFALGYEAWRWMFWVGLLPSVIFFFALLFIPESPRYLVASGKKDKAIKVLRKLMGDAAETKYAEIRESLAGDHHRPSFRDVRGRFIFRPIVWVGIGLAVFQQLVGINVVFYYGAVLWQSVGFTESHALLINVITGAVSIGASVLAMLVIDRMGRKPMLVIGSIGMAVTLGAMAMVFHGAGTDASGKLVLVGSAGPVALVAANLFVGFFNFSWGPVMWVLLGEMFPNQFRGSALAISGFAQWIANFGITMTFPIMLSGIGLGGAYFIYAGFALLSLIFVLKSVHETKGIELEDMRG